MGFGPSTEEENETRSILIKQKALLTNDLLSRSQDYRRSVERLRNCQLLKTLIAVREPLASNISDIDVAVASVETIAFDPFLYKNQNQLLSPHSSGLGQQSGYGARGSGKTAQEYVGLFTTLSQLKKWQDKAL